MDLINKGELNMKGLIVGVVVFVLSLLGAICHEADLSRNFKKTGNGFLKLKIRICLH